MNVEGSPLPSHGTFKDAASIYTADFLCPGPATLHTGIVNDVQYNRGQFTGRGNRVNRVTGRCLAHHIRKFVQVFVGNITIRVNQVSTILILEHVHKDFHLASGITGAHGTRLIGVGKFNHRFFIAIRIANHVNTGEAKLVHATGNSQNGIVIGD